MTVRIAARHPERAAADGCLQGAEPVAADLRDATSVDRALVGCEAAVNAVGLYVERGAATFEAVHVAGARQLASMAREKGIARLLHISGIGARPDSGSRYVRARAAGEAAVRETVPGAIVLRPSVMFGQDDAFLATLVSLVERLPAVPLFGDGKTRLQPVHVEDVAAAAAVALTAEEPPSGVFELGGAEDYAYAELLRLIMRHAGRRRPLVPVPFFVWEVLAALGSTLRTPPITEGQVALMRRDNRPSPRLPGLRDLGVSPTSLQAFLAERYGVPS